MTDSEQGWDPGSKDEPEAHVREIPQGPFPDTDMNHETPFMTNDPPDDNLDGLHKFFDDAYGLDPSECDGSPTAGIWNGDQNATTAWEAAGSTSTTRDVSLALEPPSILKAAGAAHSSGEMSDETQRWAAASTAQQQRRTANADKSGETKELQELTLRKTATSSSKTAEARYESATSPQPPLDGDQVKIRERTILHQELSHHSGVSHPPRISESLTGDIGRRIRSDSSMLKSSNDPQTPIIHNRDFTYAGSTLSTSSSRRNKCLFENDHLESKLRKDLDKSFNLSGLLHKDAVTNKVTEAIMSFYEKHAHGPPDDPSEDALGDKISKYDYAESQRRKILNAVDKMYYEAGWRLDHGHQEAAANSVPDANSFSSPPSSKRRSTRHSHHPAKRRQTSYSGTSPSVTRSYQKLAQQSSASVVSDSHTSVSRSSARKKFICHLCPKENGFKISQGLRNWRRHYNAHFPRYFWVCKLCNFSANRRDSVVQHQETKAHQKSAKGKTNLDEQLKIIKYKILNAGHQCCIYCTISFDGWSYDKQKNHTAGHVKDDPAERLENNFNHRCEDRDCGKLDVYWRKSEFVLASDAGDDSDDTNTENEPEYAATNDSFEPSEDGDAPAPDGSMGGDKWTANKERRFLDGDGTLALQNTLQSMSDRPEADVKSFVGGLYTLPSRPSPEVVERDMGQQLNDFEEQHKDLF